MTPVTMMGNPIEVSGNYSGMRQLKMKFVQICLDSLWICDIDF